MAEENALTAARRLEDIALDLMKFIAAAAQVGKTGTTAGFQARAEKAEDVVDNLLQLYERCRTAVEKKAK